MTQRSVTTALLALLGLSALSALADDPAVVVNVVKKTLCPAETIEYFGLDENSALLGDRNQDEIYTVDCTGGSVQVHGRDTNELLDSFDLGVCHNDFKYECIEVSEDTPFVVNENFGYINDFFKERSPCYLPYEIEYLGFLNTCLAKTYTPHGDTNYMKYEFDPQSSAITVTYYEDPACVTVKSQEQFVKDTCHEYLPLFSFLTPQTGKPKEASAKISPTTLDSFTARDVLLISGCETSGPGAHSWFFPVENLQCVNPDREGEWLYFDCSSGETRVHDNSECNGSPIRTYSMGECMEEISSLVNCKSDVPFVALQRWTNTDCSGEHTDLYGYVPLDYCLISDGSKMFHYDSETDQITYNEYDDQLCTQLKDSGSFPTKAGECFQNDISTSFAFVIHYGPNDAPGTSPPPVGSGVESSETSSSTRVLVTSSALAINMVALGLLR